MRGAIHAVIAYLLEAIERGDRDTRILLDGVNVAPAVKDYSVGQCPGEAPTLSLTLAPEILEFMGDEVDVDAFRQAVVKVPERVR